MLWKDYMFFGLKDYEIVSLFLFKLKQPVNVYMLSLI